MSNKYENELKEIQSSLEDAMKEIKTLKAQLAGNETRLYRFFIPEYDATGNKVPKEKRMDYLQVLQEASCRDNGGYTMYQGEGGYYPEELMSQPFDPKNIVKEKVIIFDTYGKNPITPERLKHCQKHLYQNSLGLMSSNSYEFIDSNKVGPYDLCMSTK